MKEIWKEIPEFEGRYLISNTGQVKRIAKYPYTKEKILSQYIKSNGNTVRLTKNGKITERKVQWLLEPSTHKKRSCVKKPKATMEDLLNDYSL